MTRKPINIARESVGLLFCQREGLESEWCVIHGSTWAPPHEKCCVEGERTVRRIAQAIEAYATEVAEQARAETLDGAADALHAESLEWHAEDMRDHVDEPSDCECSEDGLCHEYARFTALNGRAVHWLRDRARTEPAP